MPSSRAILADIHELNLDPTKPHRHTKASGRLAAGSLATDDNLVADDVQDVDSKPQVTSSTPDETKASDIDSSVVEDQAAQKKPPTKKVGAKKDKVEEPALVPTPVSSTDETNV